MDKSVCDTLILAMQVHSPFDPVFAEGCEEWWNEFPIESELISLTQLSFDALSGSTEYSPYHEYPLTTLQEDAEHEEFYHSSGESPSAVSYSVPETPEPQVVSYDIPHPMDEFRETTIEHYIEQSDAKAMKTEVDSQSHRPNDLVLVLTRQFCNTSGTEFRLVPIESAIEAVSPTLNEATRQEIKQRLAQRKPIAKPQPLPDALLHEELTRILQEHNILQKSLARTLGIRYRLLQHLNC